MIPHRSQNFLSADIFPSNRMTNGFGSDLVLLAGQHTKIISRRKILLFRYNQTTTF